MPSKSLFLSYFPTETLYTLLLSPMRAPCLVRNFLDVFARIQRALGKFRNELEEDEVVSS